VHLVRVTAIEPAALPPLEAVRTEVAREWELERRARSAEEEYRRMRARYAVTIDAERPASASEKP
jgi:hypothetical protein